MRSLKILLYFLIFINFILLGFLFSGLTGKAVDFREKANLTRVIDGDTIEIDISGVVSKVRMLGINTPEKNMEGYEDAKNFLLEFQGKEIELVRTVEDEDKYGRKLRYVFYRNLNLNQEILNKGLAHFYSYNSDEFTRELAETEEKARDKELGVWRKSSGKCSDCIILVKLNSVDPGEYVIFRNKCDYDCDLNGWTIKDDSTKTWILDFVLKAGDEKKIDYEGRIWNDDGDSFYLRDNSGLVLFYRY